MFGKRKIGQELDVPPVASNPQSREVLRVWSSPEHPHQVILRPTWKNPGAWGLMLVDIARHAANAYAREGENRAEVLRRIREMFDAEWSSPTSEAEDVTDSA